MAADYSIPSEDASGVWDIGPQYIFKTDLGSGSYGTVCEAVYVATNMPVAIKKFNNIYRNETMCKRVLREIEVSFYSTHPVLVKPLDLFCRNGIDLYLVMELAQSDLRKIQKDPIFLLEKQVKIIMYRLLLAVNYLHSGGIIHRDIKPANILLNFDCSIRLCDFSLSRSITGLNSSLFDCDQVIRKDPMLCISGSCSSMTCMRDPAPSPDPGSDIDEGIPQRKIVHCDFQVKFEDTKEKEEKKVEREVVASSGKLPPLVFLAGPTKISVHDKKKEQRKVLLSKSKEFNPCIERELSGHIATRWYRSPELIMLEKIYSTAIDKGREMKRRIIDVINILIQVIEGSNIYE